MRAQQKKQTLKTRPVSSIKHNVSMVVYGRSGTGKTTFAATAPKPMLYIDIKDEGTASIADVKGIDVFEVETFADFEDAYWWLKKNNDGKYKSIVIDTCTQLQMLVIEEILEKKGKNKSRAGEWGTMTKQDWGSVASLMKEWLINFRDLTNDGLQVIFIAQDRVFNVDEDSEDTMLTPEVGPALSPSVARTLNAAVSAIGNTYIRERTITKEVNRKKTKKQIVEYCLGLAPSPIYTRKLRKPLSTQVPEAIVDPEFGDVVDIINGDY